MIRRYCIWHAKKIKRITPSALVVRRVVWPNILFGFSIFMITYFRYRLTLFFIISDLEYHIFPSESEFFSPSQAYTASDWYQTCTRTASFGTEFARANPLPLAAVFRTLSVTLFSSLGQFGLGA